MPKTFDRFVLSDGAQYRQDRSRVNHDGAEEAPPAALGPRRSANRSARESLCRERVSRVCDGASGTVTLSSQSFPRRIIDLGHLAS